MGCKKVGFLLTLVMLVLVFHCGNCNYQQFRFLKSIRTNIVKDLEDSESVLYRDSRSIHRSRRSVLNSTEQLEAVKEHNRLRRLEGSSSMNLLIWDNDLASEANNSANKCIWNHSNTYYGQNLYSTTDPRPINLTAAIDAWYKEKPNYSTFLSTGKCNPPEQPCLHYSQVVWANTRRLGCAYTRCPTLFGATEADNLANALLLVCNYGPPGNVVSEKPYETGTGCSKCDSGSWWCNEGLCDQSCTTNPRPPSICGCAPVCLNFGSVTASNCSCSCMPGWTGVDCNEPCQNKDSMCDPKPGQSGYPPSYCTRDDYGPRIRVLCPKMCGKCTAIDTGSISSSLAQNMMLVWLSWLLPYSLRSI